ncbi:MAG TPA: DUF4055 domain-containing protein [Verrucomicrobiae bacterium]
MNSTHPDYDATLPAWLRARDVVAGEDAVKAAGEKYLPRLDSQSTDDYLGYKSRASFFNAAARTAEGIVGLIFRRDPVVRVPANKDTLSTALAKCLDDLDLLGTTLTAYARNVIEEVVIVGRCGTLVDWQGEGEGRAYASLYRAEDIRNWRVERVNGRNVLTLLALVERVESREQRAEGDEFATETVDQLRVLKLEARRAESAEGRTDWQYVVELYQQQEVRSPGRRTKQEWTLVDRRVPLRLGKPLPLIPFVFHGPCHALPDVDKLPLTDIIAVNLDHYRLSADYRHGLHFTALPTAWVSGFDKDAELRIGSSTAWVSETVGAAAGFLEFTGQGLTTFERAMDRDERLMAVLGTRMLAEQKRVGESADAIALRQSGENSVLGALATSISDSLTHVLRWCYWWHSTEDKPDLVSAEMVLVSLNTDFALQGMDAPSITALVSAWQSGLISHDTALDSLRKGEVIPDGRTNAEEKALAEKGFQFLKGGLEAARENSPGEKEKAEGRGQKAETGKAEA